MLIAQTAQGGEERWRRDDVPTLTLNGLDQYRRDRFRTDLAGEDHILQEPDDRLPLTNSRQRRDVATVKGR